MATQIGSQTHDSAHLDRLFTTETAFSPLSFRANSPHSITPSFSAFTSSALVQHVRAYPSGLGALFRLAVPAAQPALGMTHSAFRGRILAHQVQASGTMSCEEENVTSTYRQGHVRRTVRLIRKRCSVLIHGNDCGPMSESRDTRYLWTLDGGVHELHREVRVSA